MKRFTAGFLALLFLFNFCGYYALFLWLQVELKLEISARLADEKVQVLKISENDSQLIWINSHEFTYKNKLYDVTSKHKSPQGIWTITCMEDEDERELLAKFYKHFKSHHHPTKSKSKGKTTVPVIYYSTIQNSILVSPFASQACESDRDPFEHLLTITLPVEAPPPDCSI